MISELEQLNSGQKTLRDLIALLYCSRYCLTVPSLMRLLFHYTACHNMDVSGSFCLSILRYRMELAARTILMDSISELSGDTTVNRVKVWPITCHPSSVTCYLSPAGPGFLYWSWAGWHQPQCATYHSSVLRNIQFKTFYPYWSGWYTCPPARNSLTIQHRHSPNPILSQSVPVADQYRSLVLQTDIKRDMIRIQCV